MRDFTKVKNVADAIASATDGSAVDSSLAGVEMPQEKISPGNTSMPVDTYSGVHPDIQVIEDRSEGFSSQTAAQDVNINNSKKVRPATKIDFENLDESMILDLPFIKAKSFDVAAMLHMKPKDPEVRFRWVNWKSNEGSNYQMFKSIGFKNAVVADINQNVTPVGDNLLQDGDNIKYHDVILMKVNVLRLMQAYKANIQRSLQMVGRWSENALQEARRTFRNEVSPALLAQMKEQGLNVEFYTPSAKEQKDDEEREARQTASVV